MHSRSLAAVILSAGKGTRLRSDLPKALQPICGEPMLGRLIRRAEKAGAKEVVVVAGHKIEWVKKFLAGRKSRIKITCVEQKQMLGSGHALLQTRRVLGNFDGSVLVLYCDTPLLSDATIGTLLTDHRQNRTEATLLSVDCENPAGYGRVVRSAEGLVQRIVEENDATADEKMICEINVGCYVFDAKKLFWGLKKIKPSLVKKEYYLTDIVEIFNVAGLVRAVKTADFSETLGVNTRKDLAQAEEMAQNAILDQHMIAGVRIRRPQTVLIDEDVKIGEDTIILPGSVIEEGSMIGRGCTIGPSARIRGGSQVGDHAVIGNFVEIVRSKVGPYVYVKHLSYLGDAVVGAHANIGCGTITANYDGKKKHKTLIGEHARIGSGTVLIAPVSVGKHASTGAGAVLTKGSRVADGQTVVGIPAKILTRQSRRLTPRTKRF